MAHTANGEALICVVGVWVSVDNPNLPENGQSCAGYALSAESTAAGNGKELVCTAVEPAPGFQTWLYAS